MAASWQSNDAAFALGAMLPDFASMMGLRAPTVRDSEIAKGVEFHHHSDRIFHRLDRFRSQESWTRRHMLAHGLRRGPARGIAHVGVELSLDGALVANPAGHELYRAALRVAMECELEWDSDETEQRFATLVERLASVGVPDGYRQPSIVADRLVRIMEPRPLLRLSESEAEILQGAIIEVHERASVAATPLMSELRRML